MGIRYKGGALVHRQVVENLEEIIAERCFPYHDGYFGSPGSSDNIREVEVDDVYEKAREFYDKIAYGGIEDLGFTKNGNVIMLKAKMMDGTIITYREITSSPGSPAVQISVRKSSNSHGLKTKKYIL